MLNEEKIRLMTELALFEKRNASEMKTVTEYFKSDYLSRHLIRSFIAYTFCSAMIVGLWVLFNMDVVISTISMDALKGLAVRGGVLYVGGLILYLALSSMIYGRRYDYEVKMNRIYIVKLKHLDKRYEYQSRSRELAREGRRV